jgi:hypothetical protein
VFLNGFTSPHILNTQRGWHTSKNYQLLKKYSILLFDLESFLSPDTETIRNKILIAHLMNLSTLIASCKKLYTGIMLYQI